MHGERRALHQNFNTDPDSGSSESWETEDYRHLPLEELFARLEHHQVFLDQGHFIQMAQDFDSPEEFIESLVPHQVDQQVWNAVYLAVFELWRRLLPEKLCLSIFCDELDHQVNLYDQGLLDNPEGLQDALAHLQVVLEEESDAGEDPSELFEEICQACANEIESFLYEYINDQLDHRNLHYANELLDAFGDYVVDVKWFDFLRARLVALSEGSGANHLIRQVVQYAYDEKDLAFNLELLHFLIRQEEDDEFYQLIVTTLPLIETEEDYQDLLSLCSDFFESRDKEKEEQEILKLLNSRSQIPLDQRINLKNASIDRFKSIFAKR